MGAKRQCSFCNNFFSDESPMCPHCARPALYVNVDRAKDKAEQEALQRRCDTEIAEAKSRNCSPVLCDFAQATLKATAVIVRKGFAFEALLNDDSRVYATYYQECLAGARIPDGSEWDELRILADTKLFGIKGKDDIRFAALTLDDFGPSSYGDFHLHLREDMIAHRSTVFHTNSALFPERYTGIMPRTGLPSGFRATWQDRHLLCLAKLASKINSGTNQQDYGKILLTQDEDPRKEEFVEVHVWGSVTIRTVGQVVVRKNRLGRAGTGARGKKLLQDLGTYGVVLKVI